MKNSFFKAGVLAVCGSVLFGSLALAQSSKLSPELLNTTNQGSVTVIVQCKGGMLSALLASLPLVGGLVSQTLANLNIAIVSLPAGNINLLSQNPGVAYISPDRPLTQLLDYSTAAVNAGAAWQSGLTGAGVGVAVIDSGVLDTPDLSLLGVSRVVYRQNFATSPATGVTAGSVGGLATIIGGIASTGAKDGFGHGTHVAGIIASNGISSQCSNCTRSFVGVAPGASLLDLKVLDSNGAGTDSSVLAALDRAIQLQRIYNIRVINLSLGRPIYETYTKDPLCQAVEAAWKAGIVVDVAAGNAGRDNSVGNQGYGTIQSPANDPYVITVGAMKAMGTYTRTDDLIASYSSKGPSGIDFVTKPDLVAPGNHVVSLQSPNSVLAQNPATAVPLSYYESTTSSTTSTQFTMLNGTSMATPVVSGAVADMLQASPSLTPDQVKARLMKTAYKTFPISSTAVDTVSGQSFTSYYDVFTVGAGYLDVAAALANHDVASGTAMSPIAQYNATNQTVYLVFDATSVWGSIAHSAVWGTQAVWGTSTVGANRAIWGTQAVWATSTVSGFQAVWSSKGVWGTETDQATSTVNGTKAVWGTSSQTSDSDSVFTVKP